MRIVLPIALTALSAAPLAAETYTCAFDQNDFPENALLQETVSLSIDRSSGDLAVVSGITDAAGIDMLIVTNDDDAQIVFQWMLSLENLVDGGTGMVQFVAHIMKGDGIAEQTAIVTGNDNAGEASAVGSCTAEN